MKSRVIQPDQRMGSDPTAATVDGRAPEHPSKRSLAALIRCHPLVSFFVLAFTLTWSTVPIGSFMAAGPLVAALVVIAVVDGRAGLRRLGSSMLRWRVGWRWYVAALVIPLGVALGSGALTVALGAPSSVLGGLELSSLAFMLGLRMIVPVFAPVGEEPGWRGFAVPRLQAAHGPLIATLILGVVVAAWHVPLLFVGEQRLPPIFLVTTVAVTFFYSWLFNHTGASVLMTIVAHAAEGTITGELVGKDGFVGADETRFAVLYTVGWCMVAVALVVFDRRAWRARNGGSVDQVDTAPAPQPAARRTVLSRAAVATVGVMAVAVAGCSAAQRRDLGEEDVRVTLEAAVQDAVVDNNVDLDGDLSCTADLDVEPTVTATCEGTTTSGDTVSGTFDGTANVDEPVCTATLTIVIAGDEVVDQPSVNCFG